MSIETWLAFVLTSAAVVLIPGPNIVLTVNYAIRGGRRTGWATIPGVVLGAFVAMSLSLAGAGALMATSALLFSLLKFAGALYLLWLAVSLWRAPVEQAEQAPKGRSSLRFGVLFRQSFLISVLNPKGPVFYMAFVPQFVSAGAPLAPQFAILIASFLAVAALNSLFWLSGASLLRVQLQQPRVMRLVNRIGASCLALAGLATARLSRAMS